MTIDEYISRTKALVPVHPGRYAEVIEGVFNSVTGNEFFAKEKVGVDLRIISSASLFSEVVYTKPRISLIWDNYQFELIEKFFLAGICALNKKEKLANLIYKMNINAALSLRLSNISPELSYVFADHYRRQRIELGYEKMYLFSDTKSDLLYSQLLFLGHEISHIILGHESSKRLLLEYKTEFHSIMIGLIESFGDEQPYEGSRTYYELYKLLMKHENVDYISELMCDIYAYDLVGEIIERIDKVFEPGRKITALYDDLFETHRVVILTLDSFLYLLELWTRIGMKSNLARKVKPVHVRQGSPNYSMWNSRFEAREVLLFIYLRARMLDKRGIFVPSDNKKAIAIFNANEGIMRKILKYEDTEWFEIYQEANNLYDKNINPKELISERDYLLFSKL